MSAFVSEHHRELLAQGQTSFVFTFSRAEDAPANEAPGVYRSPGIAIGDLPFRFGAALDRPASAAARSLDVFHIHEPFMIAGTALRLARRLDLPLVFTNHTRHDVYASNYPILVQPSLRTYIVRTLARVIRASDLATAPSADSAHWMRSLVPNLPPERVQVLRNGIQLDAFAHIANPQTRAAFGIPAERTVFIWVGRLTPEKNLPVFAHAFRQAVEAGANAHWLLVGEGSQRAELESVLAPVSARVRFVGKVPRAEIPGYLALADVFATPSLSEANPVSVIEALACGIPYLGLQSPWWSEFSAEFNAGILTEHAPELLAAAIIRLCSSPTLRAELGLQAKRLSLQFDIRAVTTRWLAAYQSVVEAKLAFTPPPVPRSERARGES